MDKTYQPAFNKIESLLNTGGSDLSQPAIVKADPKDYLSYLFTEDNDPMGQVLLKPNPAYFSKKFPRSSPQFFSVIITGNQKDPVAASFMAAIIKATDFTALKNMLGK